VCDPHIHVGSELNLDAAARNIVASAFGMAADLPSVVTTRCGLRVPREDTSSQPAEVTCLSCREYAHRKLLHHAEQIESLGPMPGTNITVAEIREAAHAAHEVASRWVEDDTEPPADRTEP
jgi:hypothetical protein